MCTPVVLVQSFHAYFSFFRTRCGLAVRSLLVRFAPGCQNMIFLKSEVTDWVVCHFKTQIHIPTPHSLLPEDEGWVVLPIRMEGARGFAPHRMSGSSPSFNKCLGDLGKSIVPALLQVMYGWHVVPWGSPKPLQSLVKCWDLVNVAKWGKNKGRAGVAHVSQRIVIKNCYV